PVESIRVDLDEKRKLLTLMLRERSGTELPAHALSDGTLRFLVLCVMAIDPDTRGLICMEEPENGIHPGKMAAILGLLKEIAVDPEQPVDDDNPLRQVIVATHSPVFVQCQNKNDLICVARIRRKSGNGNMINIMKCLPLINTWRSETAGGDHIGLATLIDYLQKPENAPLQHELECNEP
ncbi:MAG TPA: ATP-binding protein, partial [Plasticicumulans sp.]|nr:ATP-binding protein [Plasticicumulans sp.]